MSDHPQANPQTVEFDVIRHSGTSDYEKIGSLVSWALPRKGDRVWVTDPHDPEHTAYEVMRAEFEGSNNVAVIVKDV